MSPRRATSLAALALTAWGADTSAQELSCVVIAPSMDFGTYLPASPAPVDLRGRLRIKCDGRGMAVLRVTIGPGRSGNALERHMTTPGDTLRYNIFLDAARTVVWGDGTGGTSELRKLVPGNRRNFNEPVYGRVYANQDPGPGVYSDDLVVTVIF